MTRVPKRPRDPNQLAKMVVDIATGATQDEHESATIQPIAALGRAGGLKGGQARAAALSPEKRADIARQAAAARWRKDDGSDRNSQ